jgi:hypothetical protein
VVYPPDAVGLTFGVPPPPPPLQPANARNTISNNVKSKKRLTAFNHSPSFIVNSDPYFAGLLLIPFVYYNSSLCIIFFSAQLLHDSDPLILAFSQNGLNFTFALGETKVWSKM